jgi:hypothetical protein
MCKRSETRSIQDQAGRGWLRPRELNPPTLSGRFGEGASLLGEIEVGPNLVTYRYGQSEVFLSVIVSKTFNLLRAPQNKVCGSLFHDFVREIPMPVAKYRAGLIDAATEG